MGSEDLEILSISIDKDALRQLEEVQKRLGYKSRSKMLRNAILGMVHDYEAFDALKGEVECIFVLTYSEAEKNHVSDVLHRFGKVIKTELHQHHSGTCIDILNINAPAKKTREFFGVLKRNKCIYSVTYSIIRDTK
ncbi:MAG: ribbon-helix-helix protein, CopG family [Candidatus Micrarchaeota archaeon]|nr:ribbon-helix-helix protein, CopG family [Candidatus Micrarchaeota archaeon]MDE1848172.1 ribbon-helix-helix protein, CopG family [Candidatus Micrarchaeota archaeon]MDE1864640.1 ribbon-helix-helix protein, CopG family [Candidatus Micrarchaeota archaeon]